MPNIFPEICILKAVSPDMLNQHTEEQATHRDPLNVVSESESVSTDEYSTCRQKLVARIF